MKKVFRALKICIVIAIFAVIALLIGRIMLSNHYPSGMKELYASENLLSACADGGRVEVRTQALLYSYDDPRDTRLMANHFYYAPSVGEVQVTVRYNVSILEKVKEDFDLKEAPAPSADLFAFFLVDEKNGDLYPLSHIETDSYQMYQYAKLVFSGVEFREETENLCLIAYYQGAVDETGKDPYSHITLYHKSLAADDGVFTVREEDLR